MADQQALEAALRHVAGQVLVHADEDEALATLCERTAEALRTAGAGLLTLTHDDRLTSAASTDALVEHLALLQVRTREGPAWDCAWSAEQVTTADLTEDTRWPALTEVAVEAGLRSAACFPLAVRDEPFGALWVARDSPGDWDRHDLVAGETIASVTGALLRNLRDLARATELADQLERALRSRIVVEQAKGMLAERLGVTPDEAFAVLRRTARNRRERLHDLARAVLAGERPLDG